MKKITAFILAFSLLFCFSSCKKTPTDSSETLSEESPATRIDIGVFSDMTTKSETQSETDSKSKTESATKAATTQAKKQSTEKKSDISLLSVFSNQGYFSEVNESKKKIVEINYQTLHLSEEDSPKYPALAKSLNNLNNETVDEAEQALKDLTELYYELDRELYYELLLTNNKKFAVQRADNIIFSIRSDFDEFSGGAHSIYGSGGYNFDTASGKKLVVTDVVTDFSAVYSILIKQIKAESSERVYDDFEEYLSEYSPDEFSWTLSYQGIAFHFSPYEIGSYASGQISTTIYFDEYPELFNKKYTLAPESYAIEISEIGEFKFDLNPADDKKDSLSVYKTNYSDIYYNNFVIVLNENRKEVDGLEISDIRYYAVKVKEKFFIYVETIGANKDSEIIIYELRRDNIKEAGRFTNKYFEIRYKENDKKSELKYVFNNPSEFILETRINLLSTYYGEKTYSVNPDTGLPETKDNSFVIKDSSSFTITSAKEISVEILSDNHKEKMPVGTDFRLIRTDGETYADAKLNDGRECRIYVTRGSNGNLFNVDGIPEKDAFESLYYSG